MTFDEALTFYGSGRAIARALKLSEARISQFKSSGGFPYPEQCVLEKDSARKLIARRKDEPSSTQQAA